MQRKLLCLVLVILAGFVLSASAQQEVSRFDIFTGYSHLQSPGVKLSQNGYDATVGVNATRWLGLGADFSWFKGDGAINVLDTKVFPTIKPFIPAGVTVPEVPFSATTYTFAAGPQINIRHFEKVTFFVRPGLGFIHENATPTLPAALVPLAPLVPQLKPHLTDRVIFYGFGGGFDINATKHVGFRFSTDFVHTNLFTDLLEGRNAVRFSVGPTWRFGGDVK